MKQVCGYMAGYAVLVFVLVTFTTAGYAAERGINVVKIIDAQGKEVGLYHQSHALVIGVSDYTEGWPRLPGVQQDVKAVRAALKEHGFNVETVINPTRAQLYQAFSNFINRYGQTIENRLLFYFAGHGHTRKLAYGEEMGYILPVDAPNPRRDPRGFAVKAMDMQQIEVFAKLIQSKHALFIFDSCFSGSIFSLSRAAPDNITYKTAKPVRQFITSGSADENVPDKSVFRRQFIAALKGNADVDKDGYVTGGELGEFLQKSVVNYSHNTQHPQYGKIRNPHLDKGDFVFAMPVPKPRPRTVQKPSTAGSTAKSVSPEVIELTYWNSIKDSSNPEVYRAYLKKYPNGRFADLAKIKATPSPQLKAPSETSVSRQQIDTWLRQAKGHLAAYRLTSPKGNNAHELYQKVLDINPDNPDAREGLNRIADKYCDLAMEALDEDKFAKARTYVKRGLEVVKTHEELLELQMELASEQTDSDGLFFEPDQDYLIPDGTAQANLSGVWQSQDGTIVVMDGNSYRISLGNNVVDMGSYALQGNQIVIYSMMGLNRIVSYSLQGNTLTCVDHSSGYPLTTVYYRMK